MGQRVFNTSIYYYLHARKLSIPHWLNLRNPRTFNEKIIFLKCNYRHPNASQIADKVAVRSYVQSRIGDKYLVPLIGVYQSPEEIAHETLPSQFVMKPNHGSGWVIICRDKSSTDWQAAKKQLASWLSQNYYDLGLEYQYRDIARCIIVEKFLQGSADQEIPDVKVFCFDGKPKFIQIDKDRHTNHTRSFYDTNWGELPFTMLYPRIPHPLPRPHFLEEALEIAKSLSIGFPHVRVDLYAEKSQLFFGELTLHHGGGFEPIQPRKYAKTIGDMIKIPDGFCIQKSE